MTEIEREQLDDQLAQMTRWEGESTELWREAIDRASSKTLRWSLPQFFHRRVPKIAAAIFIVVSLGTVLQFTYGPVRSGKDLFTAIGDEPASLRGAPLLRTPASAAPGQPTASMIAPPLDLASALNKNLDGDGVGFWNWDGERAGNGLGGGGLPGRRSGVGQITSGLVGGAAAQIDETASLDRQVIHKATIELLTDDVRATFLKATQLPSEARSEYLEGSSLTGAGDEMQASLTLRVAADRLSEVLNQLRKLGEVRSEDSRGEDVTSQVVDLDARLRNERRIETELLELLDKRDDAPLKEVLDLRNHINRVRQSIEQLTAQQQRLSRLVSLATILVIIRAEDAPQLEPATDLGKYFSENVGASWKSGLRFLSDTIASLLRVLVGGVIWWVLLTVAILAIMRHQRQAHLPTT